MIEVRATRQNLFMEDCVQIHIFDREARTAVKHFVMEPISEGAMLPACAQISGTKAQSLMDSLWDCGLRPSEGTGSAGALAATQRHLEDMQAIAFHVLEVHRKGAKGVSDGIL